MKLPFVSRDRFDDTKAMLEKRITDLETERQKLWDVLAYNAIHMTIFNKDLIPQPAVEPTPVLTEEQKAEEALSEIEREEVREIKATMRTRPSQLSRVMERIMQNRAQRAAANAFPPKRHNPNVQAIFEKAKSEVTH